MSWKTTSRITSTTPKQFGKSWAYFADVCIALVLSLIVVGLLAWSILLWMEEQKPKVFYDTSDAPSINGSIVMEFPPYDWNRSGLTTLRGKDHMRIDGREQREPKALQ